MTFETIKVKASFELEPPREVLGTVKVEKSSEGARSSITG